MLLPRMPYGHGSSATRSPITPKPCASSTYSSAPWRRATSANARQVGRVAGHAVDTVHADEPGGVALGAQQLVEVVGVLEAEAADRGAAGLRDLAAVVDRLVRARVEEDRARGREQRDHRHVDVGDRRQDERVLAAEQLGQPLLDLLVEHRAAEQARPARVRAPRVEGGGTASMISRSRSKPR